ncbi:unnamed protein product [Prunus brigantina]
MSSINSEWGMGKPFAPPQPQPQTAQSNSGSTMDNDQMLKVLTSLTRGLQNQAKEMSEVKKQIGQMAEFMGQFREEGKLPSSTIVNPKGGFETAKAIILRSGKEIGTNPKMSKQCPTENEKLLFKEKEEDKATAREEKPLPQFPKAPTQPNLGKLKKDGVVIQLADRSNAYPKGVLEDVLVRVNHLIFPADFYVLEMEDSVHSTPLPILLGRPFMKTARTNIDVFKGTLTMEFDGDIIDFNISKL